MKRIFFILLATLIVCPFTAFAQEEESTDNVSRTDSIIQANSKLWKGNNILFSLGYSTGSFDRGKYNGGKLDSRWGASFKSGRNIMVHRKPIANLVKFGIFIGAELTYLNFEKGHGSLSDITGGSDDDYSDYGDYYDGYGSGYDDDYGDEDGDTFTLGSHYLNVGIAIGPTATFMPFYWCSNKNVARIKVRPFFHVIPCYSALIVSNEDETNFHGAFSCFYAGGFELMWRKLSVGFEWKGGRARYKDLGGELFGNNDVWVGADTKKPRMGSKMFTVSIGVEF